MKILRKTAIFMVLLAALLAVAPGPGQAGRDFKTGWWIDVTYPQMLAQFAAEGNTLILGTSAIWFTNSGNNTIKTFLDEANRHGIKVILGLSPVWEMPTQNFINCINTYKSHPALYGWYIGDEPELSGWFIHDYLDVNPGFYHLAKQNDPDHPAFISFNYPYNENSWATIRQWYDVSDLIGIHAYPVYSVYPQEFSTGENRKIYDMWRQMLEDTEAYDKDQPIATCMGFGDNTADPFKTPTYREIRHHVFAAVVQGVDKVLFWMYNNWGEKDPKAVDNVRRMVAEMQSVGAEMNAGETFSPDIQVSDSSERLAYRYGVNGESHAIVAVNIADRAAGGSPITAQFSLPAGVEVDSVEVLHENRTIPVSNGAFRDDFQAFGVHIYCFSATGTSPAPAPEPAPAPAPAPEEPAPAPASDEPAPASDQPAPASDQPAPPAEEPAPYPEGPAPAAEEPATSGEEPASPAEEPSPAAEEPAPTDTSIDNSLMPNWSMLFKKPATQKTKVRTGKSKLSRSLQGGTKVKLTRFSLESPKNDVDENFSW
jgi:hypothetical protein